MALLLDFLTTAALLFIVSSGLMMIYGVMKIVNFAHGAIISVGGYAAFMVARMGIPGWYGWAIAFAVGFAIGALVERLIVLPLYNRPLDAILATWGLGIVLIQIITMIFGRSTQLVESPMDGTWEIFGTAYSSYRLIMIPVALVLCAAVIGLLNGTRFGIKTKAVIMNEALAESIGINASRIRFIAFSLGAGLGTLAGYLITPLSSVDPYMGVAWLINAFMLVMVAGSSFIGLMVTCLIFGTLQVLVSIYVNPVIGGMAIAVLAAITLRVRPQGFSHV
ncbi:MAG: branched-chain amino acid ABC transporter permease [Succinivibrio sp.]|nr:branched-chain amino acid ABC transporter permease [Succinivibrio sp.]